MEKCVPSTLASAAQLSSMRQLPQRQPCVLVPIGPWGGVVATGLALLGWALTVSAHSLQMQIQAWVVINGPHGTPVWALWELLSVHCQVRVHHVAAVLFPNAVGRVWKPKLSSGRRKKAGFGVGGWRSHKKSRQGNSAIEDLGSKALNAMKSSYLPCWFFYSLSTETSSEMILWTSMFSPVNRSCGNQVISWKDCCERRWFP
jgi:hypothetical protein